MSGRENVNHYYTRNHHSHRSRMTISRRRRNATSNTIRGLRMIEDINSRLELEGQFNDDNEIWC